MYHHLKGFGTVGTGGARAAKHIWDCFNKPIHHKNKNETKKENTK